MSQFPNKKSLPSIRVQKLLEREKSHFEKEIEHERVVNQQCSSAEIETEGDTLPLDETEAIGKVSVQEEQVQLPSRAISISV